MIDFKEKYKDNNMIYRSPYDARDYHFNELILAGSIQVPDNFETEKTPFIYNQGKSSMCAACAYNTLRYLQEKDQSGLTEPFAPAFNYANRPDNENFEGMYLRTVCKKGREGSIPWSELPGFYSLANAKIKFRNNKDKYLEMAKPFRINSFYQCSSRHDIQTAIYTLKGVIGGIYVTNAFYKPVDGHVIYDPNDPENFGGHAVLICGWKVDSNGKFWWRLQNSWGKEYGENGRIWLDSRYPLIESPYSVVDNTNEIKWTDYKEKYLKKASQALIKSV